MGKNIEKYKTYFMSFKKTELWAIKGSFTFILYTFYRFWQNVAKRKRGIKNIWLNISFNYDKNK